jgi:hypothetical protein
MAELPAEVEQQLADMSPGHWDILVSRLRAPDRAEAFRTAASKVVGGDRLEASKPPPTATQPNHTQDCSDAQL